MNLIPKLYTFKKLSTSDIPKLLTWFEEPHVSRWWPVLSKDETIDHFLKRIRSKDTCGYMVYLNDMPLGYIQYYYIDRTIEKAGSWLPNVPQTTLGIDQFIGNPHYIGKGHGTQFIKSFITYLGTIEPAITTIIVDPEPDNHAAIRCYEKVGFKHVGEFPTPHGHALLMRYDTTKNILGWPAQNVKLGHGSFITMGFGQNVSSYVKKRGKLTHTTNPEWFLWIKMASWRIDKNSMPLCASEDNRERITKKIKILEEKKLVNIKILNNAFDTLFEFEDSITLTLFSIYIDEEECYLGNWTLWTPSNTTVTVYTTKIELTTDTANDK